ncbi:uncharacterized protein LOC123686579 [Harmonia axyridis]|uniref:uncharacterized protein LOC123686579 n=1 Tax=Harmonia axyridis TaxID=115357 RepID=UPI001E275550|nr:uncharacterized protein LOC123686579 [Harmonia axyridis]
MVLSQSSIKKRLRQRRNECNSSSQTLNIRNRRDDKIENGRNCNNSPTIPFVPSIVQVKDNIENRNRLSNRELVVVLKRHPLIKSTAVVLNSQEAGFEKRAYINRAKQLKVVLQRNFGDLIGKFVCPPNFRPVSISTPDFQIRNLTVRLEKNATITDMVIFRQLKINRMRSLRISLPSSQLKYNELETPNNPIIPWPDTPSPSIISSMTSTTNRTQNQQLPATETRHRRRRHAEVPHRVTYRNAITIEQDELETLCTRPNYCGTLTELCPFCGALFFTREKTTRDNEYTGCCNRGAFTIPALSACPPTLKDLYVGDGPLASQFRSQIRLINSLFAVASFKTSRPIPERRGQGHWCFTICGQIYHFISGIPNSQDKEKIQLNQIYFLDVEEALARRNAFADDRVDPAIMRLMESILRTHNRYIKAYKTMGDEIRQRKTQNLEVENIIIGMTKKPVINILAAQQNQNWRPGQSDIAAIFEGLEPPMKVDLVVYPHKPDDPDPINRHQELKLLNPLADPMVYPLLFPCGDNGYSTGMKYNIRRGRTAGKTVTILQYYRFRLYVRDVFSSIHNGGKLFQQYIVDGWVKHEMSRLWWLRQNQNEFRRTAEETLRRFNQNRQNGHVGRAIILPSGFPGGDRYRQRQYLDAMTVVARFGKPDLFITFTCNPNWPEIKNNLFKHQKWENRPDLICRVFQMKLLEFINDIVRDQLYGVVINNQYVIEFQKRGLPHAHIVVTFHEDDKLKDVEMVERIINAYIPDRENQPLLYQRVADFHLHPPCGRINPEAPCMADGKCTKYYPKSFREKTTLSVGRNTRPE